MSWWNLFKIIGRNIRNDLVANIFERFPLLLIINPDSFQPPFTNGFDEYFNVTSPSIMNNQYSDVIVVNYMIVTLSILLAGLDIVYSIIRLSISTMIVGLFLGSMLFFSVWFLVTASRRWKVLVLMFQNNEFSGVW
ncbi:uncharacterized protein SPAPADRAFT_140190 [Spathaspora passalidarum NRRL Y-27907]|uniref:Uncharacterized protein n=1 Tax=Spathaspora passalidarum (strain NRRL Y-27907 / 11-Y1) TaxID=619300 RepID=G3AQH7_SPAPN|nr:uncharacterized protein SPAPADRAFT_140190 [Spathaspora passalidarum NRRL Y-27907]EGW31525.1 hypothetical protein SPAPADRAFT_140190 [Spathaspora passalidarum NRRL Y-27907]